MAKEPEEPALLEDIEDDRVIYFAVRYRGQDGLLVEGGYNKDFDVLGKARLGFVIKQALDAVVQTGLAIFPDDPEWQAMFMEATDVGKSGADPGWRHDPATPSDAK